MKAYYNQDHNAKSTISVIFSLFVLLNLIFTNPTSAQTWNQIGLDISGNSQNEYVGRSVAMNADGTSIVIGSSGFVNSTDSGAVRVYNWDGNNWTQRGQTIMGMHAGDMLGKIVAMNSDGNEIALSAPGNSDQIDFEGAAYVFTWNGTSWVQKGSTIYGDASGDELGISMSMSADGNTIAIGAPSSSSSSLNAGKVMVFQWNGSDWMQMGGDLSGASLDSYGSSLSLNSSGSKLAVGADGNDGYAQVLSWNGSAWQPQGSNLNGAGSTDLSGASVSLSQDGSIIAVGSSQGDGHTYVYSWDGSQWQQKGDPINGQVPSGQLGYAVVLNSDGNSLAVGGPGSSSVVGITQVYDWNGASWNLRGSNIVENVGADGAGISLAFRPDGNELLIGSDGYSPATAYKSGRARVFLWNSTTLGINQLNQIDVSLYPNPTAGQVSLSFPEIKNDLKIQEIDMLGNVLETQQTSNSNKVNFDVNGAPGCYFLRISDENHNSAVITVMKY